MYTRWNRNQLVACKNGEILHQTKCSSAFSRIDVDVYSVNEIDVCRSKPCVCVCVCLNILLYHGIFKYSSRDVFFGTTKNSIEIRTYEIWPIIYTAKEAKKKNRSDFNIYFTVYNALWRCVNLNFLNAIVVVVHCKTKKRNSIFIFLLLLLSCTDVEMNTRHFAWTKHTTTTVSSFIAVHYLSYSVPKEWKNNKKIPMHSLTGNEPPSGLALNSFPAIQSTL